MNSSPILLMETQGLPRREWQVGKAKIFLRACVHEPIEDKRMHTLNRKATVIQKFNSFRLENNKVTCRLKNPKYMIFGNSNL